MKLLQTLIESLELTIIDERNKTYKFKPYEICISKYFLELKILREIKYLKIKEISLNYKTNNIDKISLLQYKEKMNHYIITFTMPE